MFNSERVVVFLRHAAGSGSSSLANYLAQLCYPNKSCEICGADEYFEQSGQYKFEPEKLGAAHNYCRNKFSAAIKDNVELIIVANTGGNYEKEVKWYEDAAKQNGYTFICLIVENRNGTESIHNLDIATLNRQANKIKESLKLI